MNKSRNSVEINELTVIIAVNVVFWLVFTGLLSIVTNSGATATATVMAQNSLFDWMGVLITSAFTFPQDSWRLISSMYLHSPASPVHLLFNMLALWNLGRFIYTYYGSRLFFIFYTLSGVAGSLFSLVMPMATVGASGAVFGLMGVLVAAVLKKQRYGQSLPIDRNRLLLIVGFSFAAGFMPGIGAINVLGHIGGFLAGFGLGYFINHRMSMRSQEWVKPFERYGYWICVAITVLSLLVIPVYLFSNLILA